MSAILILCGGSGTRIGLNKAFLELSGEPLLINVIKSMLGSANEIMVVIGKDQEPGKYAHILPPEVKVVRDAVAARGPLAGIIAGMRSIHSDYTAVFPCDSPFISKKVLKLLFDEAQGKDAAIPKWPNKYIEPLHAVYKVSSALSAAKNAMKTGRLSVIAMIDGLRKVVYVDTEKIRKLDPELLTFFNINSKEDLEAARKIATKLKSLSSDEI